MDSFRSCRNILCVRLDNIGDVIMSAPAIKALKDDTGAQITLLTSASATSVTKMMPYIDNTISYNADWVKHEGSGSTSGFRDLISELKQKNFDGAIIFSVYSQNPMPSFLLTWLAEIPLRAGYCRENPYHLLTHWIPDKEPYSFIQHQVKRDLNLVRRIGFSIRNDSIVLQTAITQKEVYLKLKEETPEQCQCIILHPGVSENKRKYPLDHWISIARLITSKYSNQVFITGSSAEIDMCQQIAEAVGERCKSIAGVLSLEEFYGLIKHSALVVSVNTSVAHLAAGAQTSAIILYALTNPQHPPWKGKGFVVPYSISVDEQSKNEVIRFTSEKYFRHATAIPSPEEVMTYIERVLSNKETPELPELITT